MIRQPRRSVTRFFIPLIDVLILLFCIFLLMPIVDESSSGPGGDAKLTAGEAQVLRQRLDQLQRRVVELEQTRESPRMRELQEELERLRQEAKVTLEQRLLIRTFQIDPKTGALTYSDPERIVVRDQGDARRLIDRDQRAARENNRELYYLILYPREKSLYPTETQEQQYERWFQGVTLGWDVPRRGPGGGRRT
jgi:hypothetical protein